MNKYYSFFSAITQVKSRMIEQKLCRQARKLVNGSPMQQIPKLANLLIFSSLGLKLLIFHFKKLMYPNTSLTEIAR